MLLESVRTIDPIGSEINHSNSALPTRELFYRGYYEVDATFDMEFGYDLLIANYKSTQVPGGITAVEDYFIRDQIAACTFDAMMQEGHWQMKEYPDPGMWGTARNIGGLVATIIMPTYSTRYYGTSGFDGNTTVYPYTPFPDTPLTWKKVFLDNNATMTGYPNLEFRMGAEEYMTSVDGHFLDRVDYYDLPLMGHCFYVLANMTKIHTSVTYPHLEASFVRAVNGTLLGLKDPSEGTRRFSCITILNKRFPNVAVVGVPWMKSLPNSSDQREDYNLFRSYVYGLVWYENPSAPYNVKVNFQ
jgi:hypothetical protein